jgi:actin-related protein 9
MSTPAGTGANTPQPQIAPTHHASGVNPLLLAATTASNPALAPPMPGTTTPSGQQSQLQQSGHHSGHGQTPTSIKLAKMADYFPEWKEVGFEEAHFLGAQVAAKIIFVIDQGLSKGFMTRTEYNELGPQGIHEFAMC